MRFSFLSISTSAIIILVLLVGVTMSGSEIPNQKKKNRKGSSGFIELFAPPKDLFKPLVKEPIDVSTSGVTKRVTLKHKYLGRHKVALLAQRFSENLHYLKQDKPQVKLKVDFYVDGKQIISRSTHEEEYSPFLGKEGSGFTILIYRCPEDVPQGKPVVCEITVLSSEDKEFLDSHGPIWFSIQKMSDL